jgi:hypothetical protein
VLGQRRWLRREQQRSGCEQQRSSCGKTQPACLNNAVQAQAQQRDREW